MEAERRAMRLAGVLFRYYRCGECGYDAIFVDSHPLPAEAPAAFRRRHAELEATLAELHGERVEVVLTERSDLALELVAL
jgi:hypothetical protein